MILNLEEQLDIASLSDAEKSVLVQYCVQMLKTLRSSMLRSDWHAAFEAALHCTILGYEETIHLLVEEELGIEPPRADFIVVVDERGNEKGKKDEERLDEPIFSHFRGHNIIEYKNPNDQLNESVLWKTIGYAELYIAERGVEEKDVTLTIIRARKNEEFFERLEQGKLLKTDTLGVYNVADRLLPTRIILTDELKGERYAAYRAISDKPKEADIEYLIDAAEVDEEKRKYLRVILNLVAIKHPDLIEEIKGRDKSMTAKWMEIFKDEIGERIDESKLIMLVEMVGKGIITIEQAAQGLDMTVDEFKKAVENLKVTA